MTPEVAPKPKPNTLRTFVLPALFGAFVTFAFLYIPVAGWTSREAVTGGTAYPDLTVRVYDASPTNTLQYAAAAASGIPGFTVTSRDEETGVLRGTVRTTIPLFTDDLTVTVTPEPLHKTPSDDNTRVEIASRSRLPLPDFGENARHIRALQTAMDARLPQVSR